MQPKVAIIILNWNGWQDTVECVESLSKIDYHNYHIYLVDNASTDQSIEKLRPYEGEKVTLLCSKINLGYAKGNNYGVKKALKDSEVKYVFILNNDTTVEPDFLSQLVKAFDLGEAIALAGPKIIDYYSKKYWQSPHKKRFNLLTYIMFLTPIYRFFLRTRLASLFYLKGTQPEEVYGIPGCSMLFEAEKFKAIGLFDENTFLGSEEYIVAEKFLQKGWKTIFVPQSIIYHKLGQDTKKMIAAEKTLSIIKSERYFLDNYLKFSAWQRVVIGLVRMSVYTLAALFNLSYRKNLSKIARIIFTRVT